MKFFNTAEIGTSDVVLYEVPATLEASIPILFFHNKTGSAVDLTLKVYDHSNVSTGTIWPEQIAADEKFVFSKALLLNEGDKLIASASVDASIDATLCGISSMAVPISGPLNPLGDWNSITPYLVRDLIFDDDTSWICVSPNANSQPSLVNPNWMVLGKQGVAGVTGFEADGSITATGSFDMGGFSILENGTDVGQILYFAMDTAPPGTMKANGALLLRIPYARLFGKIGTTFGSTDITNFAVPDERGLLPRGWDDGRGIDPGRVFGSFQEATRHPYIQTNSTPLALYPYDTMPLFQDSTGPNVTRIYSPSNLTLGGLIPGYYTSRPPNSALLACIKY